MLGAASLVALALGAGAAGRYFGEFAVTNQRVIVKVGLISRTTVELNLGKLETVAVDQSLLGRLLGYGSVAFVGSGGSLGRFGEMCDPTGFRMAAIQAQEQRAHG